MTATQTRKRASVAVATKRLHNRVAMQLLGLPKPVCEYRFHDTRRWRFDYAWPDLKIALEIHGATYKQGRHVTGSGFAGDREKMNEAQLLGWMVIEAATDNVDHIRTWIETAFKIRL